MQTKEAISYIIKELKDKLPEILSYHTLEHTLEVMDNVKLIAISESLSQDELDILLTAAAFHDSGFTRTFENHEFHGCKIASEVLPKYGYTNDQIEDVHELIMSTKIPQNATSLQGRIICDADLEYLCGDNYDEVANTLYKELLARGFDMDNMKWLDIQISFLQEHHFWTNYCKQKGDENKEQILLRLIKLRDKL